MTQFTQRTGKFNFQKLSNTDTTSIINLYYQNGWKDIQPTLTKFSALENNMHGAEPGVIYGKPNSILRECENSPGVWVFDFSNNITLFMFSDGFRKNHYKGTSYEVELKEDLNEKSVVEALESFFEDFQMKFKSQYAEKFEILNKIMKKNKPQVD